MREIKFRGKCSHCDELVYGNLVDYGEDEIPEIHGFDPFREGEENWRNVTVDRDSICQFTGIKDALYHEIYEGDIVKIDGCPEKGCLVVVFYEGSFALATPKEYDSLQRGEHPYLNDYACLTPLGSHGYQGLYKIIGNVIENPEMIKV